MTQLFLSPLHHNVTTRLNIRTEGTVSSQPERVFVAQGLLIWSLIMNYPRHVLARLKAEMLTPPHNASFQCGVILA